LPIDVNLNTHVFRGKILLNLIMLNPAAVFALSSIGILITGDEEAGGFNGAVGICHSRL